MVDSLSAPPLSSKPRPCASLRFEIQCFVVLWCLEFWCLVFPFSENPTLCSVALHALTFPHHTDSLGRSPLYSRGIGTGRTISYCCSSNFKTTWTSLSLFNT